MSHFNNLWADQTKEVCSQREQKVWQAAPALVMQAGERAGAMALRQEGAICFNEQKEGMCDREQRPKDKVTPTGRKRDSHSRPRQQVRALIFIPSTLGYTEGF